MSSPNQTAPEEEYGNPELKENEKIAEIELDTI